MKKLFITIILLSSLTACKNINAQSKNYAEVKKIKAIINDSVLGKNYNGSVLIAEDDNILLRESYGVNHENKSNHNETLYEIASMGKMFTATSIMQLVEKNKLSLDQTIGELLKYYPNKEAKNITIQQLLSHTSGLGDFFSPEFDKKKETIKSLKDYLPFFVNDPLEFKSGEQMRYSNAGFIVLGLIIEEVTNLDYKTYVKKHIFNKLNMNSTGPLVSSAGGGKSTINDFLKFANGLKNHKLITSASLKLMTTDHFKNGYGYGMSLRNLNGSKIYGHNGGAPGVSGELDIVEESDLVIITLSNRSPMDGWAQLRNNIRKLFFGSTPEIEQFLNTEKVVKIYQENGFEKASDLLTKLNNNISDKNTFRFAEKYAMQGKPDKAIDILKLIVQAYSDQWYPYSFLADFQLQAGQKEEAIKNYKKSLEMNPKNQQAIDQLKKMNIKVN